MAKNHQLDIIFIFIFTIFSIAISKTSLGWLTFYSTVSPNMKFSKLKEKQHKTKTKQTATPTQLAPLTHYPMIKKTPNQTNSNSKTSNQPPLPQSVFFLGFCYTKDLGFLLQSFGIRAQNSGTSSQVGTKGSRREAAALKPGDAVMVRWVAGTAEVLVNEAGWLGWLGGW